jgi:hypothetical protein
MASLLTGPSPDEKWNATHAYTLRGVVNEANTVYLRIRGPVGEPRSESAENDPVQVEDRWWKVSFKSEDNTVEQSVSTRSAAALWWSLGWPNGRC